MFSTPFLFLTLVAGLLTAALFLGAEHLVAPIFADGKTNLDHLIPSLTRIIRYAAVILLLDTLAILPFAVLRLEHRAKKFAGLKLLNVVVTLLLNYVFIINFGWGIEGIFLANLIASLGIVLCLVPTMHERLELRIDRAVLRKLLPFGLTNVPAYVGAMMVQVIDRPIVQHFLGLAWLGIYQANYRMGFTMMVFVSLFEYAWRPFFLRQARTDDARARALFSRVLTYFLLVALLAFLALSLALPYIVTTPIFGRQLLKSEYLQGLNIIPVILAAYLFQGLYTNFIAGIYIKENNRVLPAITGIGALVNILANLWLVPTMGIMGAAIATLLAYAVMAIAIYIASQRVYPIAYEWGRVGMLALIVFGAYGAERGVTHFEVIQGKPELLLFRIGIFFIAVLMLFVARFFSDSEIRFLREILAKSWRTPMPARKPLTNDPIEVAKTKEKGS